MLYSEVFVVNSSLWLCAVSLFLVLMSLLIARSAYLENFRWCFSLFLVGLAGTHFLGVVDIPAFFESHWRLIIAGFGVYLTLGFPYVYLYEWDRFLEREYQRREEFLEQLPAGEAAAHPYSEPIKARKHKRLITGWMLWWPMMLVYAVVVRCFLNLAEHIISLWRKVFEALVELFQQKSDSKFRRIIKRNSLLKTKNSKTQVINLSAR